MSKFTQNTTPLERSKGCTFSELFKTQALVESNGGTVGGTPTFGHYSVDLNGSTDYITYTLSGQELNSAEISIVVEFEPDFDTDEDTIRCFYDDISINYRLLKHNNSNSNVLVVYLGGVLISFISEASYSPYWLINQRNILVISGTSGNTSAWLNGNQILTSDASAWTPVAIIDLSVGEIASHGSRFKGKINKVQIYNTLLTALDALVLYQGPYSLISNLISEGALVLYHDYRNDGTATDLSGNNNDGVLTDTIWTNREIAFPASTSVVTVTDSAELRLSEGTLIQTSSNLEDSPGFDRRCVQQYDSYEMRLTAGSVVSFRGNTTVVTLAISVNGKKYLAINFKDGETPECFLDGVSAGNLSGVVPVTPTAAQVLTGNSFTGYRQVIHPVQTTLIINRELTAIEHLVLSNELASLRW